MILLDTRSPGFRDRLESLLRPSADDTSVRQAVAAVLEQVRQDGDAAVSALTARFDKAQIPPGEARLPAARLAAAARALSGAERRAIQASLRGVTAYHRRCLPRDWMARTPLGARAGERYYPIRRCGLYIPGGQVPLVSTVIMTAAVARVARVPEVVVCTPPGPDGEVAPALLAALHLAGVREVYRIGGAQAIAAMAYGTASLPAVDKVFGPGNAYVVEAKRQVFGWVGVDLLPGPSEVMVIADRRANPEWVASDLLAQAEHGSGRERIFLVSTDAGLVSAVEGALSRQLAEAGRAEAMRAILERAAVAVLVPDLRAAASVANRVAPEHLELEVAEKSIPGLVRSITTAGAIMVGGWSPTAVADFVAGPSHTLPTGGCGRFSSGLRVEDFLRRSSLVRFDRTSLRRALPFVQAFGRMERLDAHARSLEIRFRKEPAP